MCAAHKTCYACLFLLYTCQLFPSQRREIFNRRVPGFLKTTRTYLKFYEEFWRRSKQFWSSKENDSMLRFNAPKSEILGKLPCGTHLLFQLHGVFVSQIGVSLHLLGKCFNSSCYSSHFSSRRENLVRKRELVWDWSFQLAGMRLMPKLWELAGILLIPSKLYVCFRKHLGLLVVLFSFYNIHEKITWLNFFMFILLKSNLIGYFQFGIHLYLWVFQEAKIALAEAPYSISAFWKLTHVNN